jgi:hypothetical protein
MKRSELLAEGGIVKSCGSTQPADDATTSSCLAIVSPNTPFRNVCTCAHEYDERGGVDVMCGKGVCRSVPANLGWGRR